MKPQNRIHSHKIRKITEDRLKPYIKRQSSILPVISEYTALLFIHLFTFHCQIFHPSVFLIIQVHSRDLYKFIQADKLSGKNARYLLFSIYFFPYLLIKLTVLKVIWLVRICDLSDKTFVLPLLTHTRSHRLPEFRR